MRQTISYRGKRYKVLRKLELGRREYFVVKDLSSLRERYQAFDPHAGDGGDMRAILVFENTKHARSQLKLIKSTSQSNTNFPTVLEYHFKGKLAYVVTTWVKGDDLASHLVAVRNSKTPRPSPREVVRLCRGLAHGVSNLNQKKNIIHGDIKPANIILMREPTRLCLIDFGSAWFTQQTMLSRPSDGATPVYAAPEQLSADDALGNPDFRSDQFSLSVVFYELLTLSLPYSGLGGAAGLDEEHRMAFASTQPKPSELCESLSDLPVDLWRRVDRLVLRGLSLIPADRYPNRREWLKDFDHIHAELRRLDDSSPLAKSVRAFFDLPWRYWKKWRKSRIAN